MTKNVKKRKVQKKISIKESPRIPQRKSKSKNKSQSPKSKRSLKSTQEDAQSTNSVRYTKFNAKLLDQHIFFKKYITGDEANDKRFICLACKEAEFEDYSGYYDYLGNHFKGVNHKTSILLLETQELINDGKDDQTLEKEDEIKNEINQAIESFYKFRTRKISKIIVPKQVQNEIAIQYTVFLLKKELPFSLVSDLITFTKHLIQKYGAKAIQDTSVSNVTAGQISRECISKSFKEAIFEDLKNTPFALMFDESSDLFGPSFLCTHVRYIKDGKILNRLLSLEQINEDVSGQSLLSIVQNKIFNEDKEAYLRTNLVGICSDKGPNMISCKDKGLLNRLQHLYKDILIVHDFSHAFNLVIAYALKTFPEKVLTLMKSICNHFSRSALRRSQFKQVQVNLQDDGISEIYQIIRYIPTNRWTSLLNSTKRILTFWFSLETYFGQIKEEVPIPDLTNENCIIFSY